VKRIYFLWLACLILGVGGVCLWLGSLGKSHKVAFIQNQQVFDEFKGKKEMEQKLVKTQEKQKHFLDSLEIELRLAAQQKNAEKYQRLELKYTKIRQEILETNDKQKEQMVSQLLKQINTYAQEYAQKEGYDYILGAAGGGSVIFVQPKYDITKEVIQYINGKYEGK
jgi:Skp family chaperone for outer membrane proteins